MGAMEGLMQERETPVLIADRQGYITYVSAKFREVWKWNPGDLIGKPLTAIIPRNLHDSHHLGFSRFLSTEKPTLLNQPLRLKILNGEGRELDAEHRIVAEKNSKGQWVFGATIRPL